MEGKKKLNAKKIKKINNNQVNLIRNQMNKKQIIIKEINK